MKNIFLISHQSELEGPIDYYESYLVSEGHHVTKLAHPLVKYDGHATILSSSMDVLLTRKRHGSSILNLFVDFYFSLKYIPRNNVDIVIAANNFDTFSAIIARRILRKHIKMIYYFASDFSEQRFNNPLLDGIYYFIEKVVIRHADLVISNTVRAEKKRISLGLDAKKSVVVPNGVLLTNLSFSPKAINKSEFVYVGSVTKEHGLYELLEIIIPIVKKLVIIGQGEDLERVIALCNTHQLDYVIERKKSHKFVIDFLSDYHGIGLAPYNLESKWTYYCSPLKVNEYIACGIPVIISTVPEISTYVEENKLGIVYTELKTLKLLNAIEAFDTSKFNVKARDFYRDFNRNFLFERIIL